jgi:NagD protein
MLLVSDSKPVLTWLTDMDGVLVHEERPIPGAADFLDRLRSSGLRFLVLTNNSIFTPRDLRARLLSSGLDVPEASIWTSALATAQFLDDQRPGGSAYTIGEAGLTTALHEVGYVLTGRNPDYVVLGETRTYSFEAITTAIPADRGRGPVHRDQPGRDRPVAGGLAPGVRVGGRADHAGDREGAVLHRQAEPADDAQRAQPHRGALGVDGDDRRPDGHRRDLRPGGGLRSLLVLSGSTSTQDVERYPYRAHQVFDSIADLVDLVGTDATFD